MRSLIFLATDITNGTISADELVEDIQKGVIQQQIEKLIPQFWSFLWCVVLSIVVFFIGSQIIKGIIKLTAKALTIRNVDTGVATFLESVLRWILYIILLTIILGLFGVTTTSISAAVAGLGVTRSSFKLFAVLADYIIEHATNQEGRVEKINIIYTSLKMIDGRMVQIPNGTLSSASLTNCTSMTRRMFNETVGISYSSDIKRAKGIMEYIATQQDHRISSEPISVFVAELGDSAVQIGLRFWIETEYYWETKWRVLEQIKERFDKAGIEICFNQLDVHIKKED